MDSRLKGQGEKSRKPEKAETVAEQVQESKVTGRRSQVVSALPAKPSVFPQPIPERLTESALCRERKCQSFSQRFPTKTSKGLYLKGIGSRRKA